MTSTWAFTSYSPLFLAAIFSSVISVVVASNYRKQKAGREFLGLTVAILVWTIAAFFEASAVQLTDKILITKFTYIGVIHVGPLFLLFSAKFTHQDTWINWRTLFLLWIFPTLVIGLVWTNEIHQLFWNDFIRNPDSRSNLVQYVHGPAFWIFPLYFYICYGIGCYFLIKGMFSASKVFLTQFLLILFGTLAPFFASLVFLSPNNPVPGLDLTGVSFSLTSLTYSLAIFRLNFLNLSPIARTSLVDEIADGMLVINQNGYLIDINQSAMIVLSPGKIKRIGVPVEQALKDWSDLLICLKNDDTIVNIHSPYPPLTPFEARIKPIFDHNHFPIGKVVILHDMTQVENAKKELMRSEASLRQIFDISPYPLLITRIQDGKILMANQACLDLFELTRSELSQYRSMEFYKNPTERNQIAQKAAAEGKVTASEIEFITRSGKLIWGTMSAERINFMDEDCFLVGLVDITEIKNSKSQLQEVNSSLEKLIVESNEFATMAEQHALEFQLLKDIGSVITSSLDRNQTIDTVLQQLSRIVSYQNGVISLLQEREMIVLGSRGEIARSRPPGMLLPLELNDPEFSIFQNKKADLFFIFDTSIPKNGKSVLCVPLFSHNEVIGAITLENPLDRPFSDQEMNLVNAFADQVAIALENARLFSETNQRAEQLTILNRIATAMTSGLELEPVLKRLQEECRAVLPYDSFYVALINPENSMIEFPLFWEDGHYLRHTPYTIDNPTGTSARVIKEKRTLYLPNKDNQDLSTTQEAESFIESAYSSYLGVPLKLRDEVLGVIALRDKRKDAYSIDQIHLFETIASQAAIAIENARLYTNVQRLALTDPLTGVFNRRHFRHLAEKEKERSIRYQHPFSVLMADIDFFKKVNDTYGHQAGDAVLINLTVALRENLREVDVIGRYGGEEFIILLPETNLSQAESTAERLRIVASQIQVPNGNQFIHISISIGFNTWVPEINYSLDECIRRADEALYQAKTHGRNQIWGSEEIVSA